MDEQIKERLMDLATDIDSSQNRAIHDIIDLKYKIKDLMQDLCDMESRLEDIVSSMEDSMGEKIENILEESL